MKKPLYKVFLMIFIIVVTGCHLEKQYSATNNYLRWVDDIEFDPLIDDQDFKLCKGDSSVVQYFNTGNGLEYTGEKIAIDKIFQERYDANKVKKESGLIRIRFMVNCKGETDRFRITAMDENYNKKQFDKSITNQLLAITKTLSGWKPKESRGVALDYYQYLIFKVQQGKIVRILP